MTVRPLPLLALLCCVTAAACSDDDPVGSADLAVADAAPDRALPSPDRGPGTDGSAADRAPGPDAAPASDRGPGSDAIPYFPSVLDGIWLVGWSGGLRHFSWIRFSVKAAANGTATVLDGKALPSNAPLWSCSGAASWAITARPRTVQINFPGSTCTGHRSDSYTFANFKQPGVVPKGANLRADVTGTYPSGVKLEAFKFPASQCNAAMTTCKNPF